MDIGCLHTVVIVNNVVVIIGVQIYFQLVFSFSLDEYPEGELLDSILFLFLIFQGKFTVFPIVTIPNYIPTNSIISVSFSSSLTSPAYTIFCPF